MATDGFARINVASIAYRRAPGFLLPEHTFALSRADGPRLLEKLTASVNGAARGWSQSLKNLNFPALGLCLARSQGVVAVRIPSSPQFLLHRDVRTVLLAHPWGS